MDNYFFIKHEKFRHTELIMWVIKELEDRVNEKRTSFWDVLFKNICET